MRRAGGRSGAGLLLRSPCRPAPGTSGFLFGLNSSLSPERKLLRLCSAATRGVAGGRGGAEGMGMGLICAVHPRSPTPSFSRALAGTRWEYRGRGLHRQKPGPQGPGPATARTLAVLGPIRVYLGSPPGRRKRGWDGGGTGSTLGRISQKFARSADAQ